MSHVTKLWHEVTHHLKTELGSGGSNKAKTIAPYPARISAEEIMNESFTAPAIFVQLVDWAENECEQGCYVDANFLFMCVTKHYKSRTARAFEAAALGEKVWCTLKDFHPGDLIEGSVLASLNDSVNGFSRGLDNRNQALWIVSATYTLPLACHDDVPLPDLTQWDIFDGGVGSYSDADYPDTNADGYPDLPDTPSASDPVIEQHNSSESQP